MENKKVLIAVGVIAILLIGAILILSQINAQNSKTVIFGTYSKTISYAPLYVALENGWIDEVFKKYDLNYEFIEFQSTPSINESLASKKLDIIAEAEIPATVGRAAGIDLQIQGIEGTYYQELVVPKDSNIYTYADLKDLSVAVQSGTSSHYSLSKMIEQSGLHRSDIRMIDLTPADGQVAFVSGQVSAWAVWPPFVEKEQLTGKVRTIRGKDILSIIAVRVDFAKQNSEFTKEFLAVIQKSKVWVVEHPIESQEIVSKRLNLDPKVVELDWPKNDFTKQIGPDEIKDIQAKANFLYEIKLIKNKVNAEEFVLPTN